MSFEKRFSVNVCFGRLLAMIIGFTFVFALITSQTIVNTLSSNLTEAIWKSALVEHETIDWDSSQSEAGKSVTLSGISGYVKNDEGSDFSAIKPTTYSADYSSSDFVNQVSNGDKITIEKRDGTQLQFLVTMEKSKAKEPCTAEQEPSSDIELMNCGLKGRQVPYYSIKRIKKLRGKVRQGGKST